MLPAIAEIVFVDQFLADSDDLVEGHGAFVLEHVGKFTAGCAVLLHAQPESMHVAVGPTHDRLQNVVQLAEPDVGEDDGDDGDDGNDDGEIDDDEVFMETIKSSANSDVNNEDAKSLSTPPAVPDAKEAPLPPRPARVKEAITPEILERLQPALDFAKLDPQARKEIYDNLNAKRAGDISGV